MDGKGINMYGIFFVLSAFIISIAIYVSYKIITLADARHNRLYNHLKKAGGNPLMTIIRGRVPPSEEFHVSSGFIYNEKEKTIEPTGQFTKEFLND